MQLEFCGAAREVTGSCYLLRIGHRKILIDCGLIQGRRCDEARNAEPFPFNPETIDAVVLSHAHLDHSGRLPLLVQRGYQGPIYTHEATADLCRIMLQDAAYIHEREAEWENRKRERKGLPAVQPLYTRQDAERVQQYFKPLPLATTTGILPGVELRLQDAGHILGSAIIELQLRHKGRSRKIVCSGDLGHRGAPILRDPSTVTDADLVLLEGTYGDRCHRPWQATWEEFGEVFTAIQNGRGNILIPAFAIGRTQELLYIMSRHRKQWNLDDWHIFLDSPLAIKATELYAHHLELYDSEARKIRRETGTLFDLPNLKFTESPEQSMALNRIRAGAVIIAGSGMCTGGRIKHHLKHNAWRSECHIVIVGFQARGTLGRKLVDGARYIRLWGETIRVAAQVHTIGGLSAHADQQGLLDWYSGFGSRPRVALVHGEEGALTSLAEQLQNRFAVTPLIPSRGAWLDL